MHTATKVFKDIPFAHRQPNHSGHCRLIHGHNWTIGITMIAGELDKCGFVQDFGEMKEIKEWITKNLDHRLLLNSDDPILTPPAPPDPPDLANPFLRGLEQVAEITTVPDCSCEGLARTFHETFDGMLNDKSGGRVRVLRVEVEEDSKNSATYEQFPTNFLAV